MVFEFNEQVDSIDFYEKKTFLNEIKPTCIKPIIWKKLNLNFLTILKSLITK